jgi:Bacterial Ig domain
MRVRALALLTLACAIAAALGTGTSLAACPETGCPGGGGGGTVSFTLSVSKSAGTVTSAPAGINCGSTCEADFTEDTSVTLNASGGPSGYSPSWSGACSGSSCSVTMDGNKTATLAWIDSTPPSAGLSSPPAKAGPSTVFNATATDNSGTVSKVDFYVDGVLRATDTSAPFQYHPDLSPFTDGTDHVVKVISQDGSGNVSSSLAAAPSATFTVDKHATLSNVTTVPAVVSAVPSIGFTKESDMTVTCSTEKLTTGPTVNTTGCTSPYSPSNNGDGDYTVTLQGTDDVGNTATVTRSYSLDTTNPSLTINSPSDGDVKTQGFTPNITATDAHGPTVQCRIDSAAYGSCGPQTGSAGPHTFWARATDDVGNVTEKSVSFSFAASTGTPSGNQQQQGSVGPQISDAAIADKLVADLKAGVKTFAKQKEKRLAKKGKYSFTAHALMGGRFALAFTGAATKAKAAKATKIATVSRTVAGPGTYKLTLKLTKAGKKLLRKGRRVRGKLTLSFTPQGRAKVSRNRSLTLKRR